MIFGTAATATDFSPIQDTLEEMELGAEDSLSFRKPNPGELIDDLYRVEQSLGPNRYVVTQRLLGERFELRLLPFRPRSAAMRRIDSAVRSASLVGHQNLAVVTDLGLCRSVGSYAVLKLVQGDDVATMIEQTQQFSIDEVVRFAIEMGGALGALHEVGVTHGLVDPVDLVRSDQGWHLLGAGLPASPDAVWRYRAPEVEEIADVTPESDQWAVAAIMYEMLTGTPPTPENLRPPGRRAEIPSELDKAIVKALAVDPSDRWRQMESLLDVLQSSFRVWRQPTIVPLDAREVSRLLKLHPDSATDFSNVRENTRQSVVVRVDDLKAARPELGVSFRNIARLRREYRHNLAHGGLFVPTPTPPEPSTEVTVELDLIPTGATVELEGIVTHTTEGDEVTPPGAGIVFEADSIDRLLDFLRSAGVIQGIRAQDTVRRVDDFAGFDKLGAEQLFLLSAMMGDVTVADLRSEASSMPLDFEETLQSLVEAGAVIIDSAPQPTSIDGGFQPARPASSADAQLKFAEDDLEFLLEQIEFHEERRSYLAAFTLIQRGLKHLPDEPRLHHRLAVVQGRGLHDLIGALEAARRAVDLDGDRREYAETLKDITRLVERESIRRIYRREFPVTDVHFVGWDQSTHCIWVLTRSRLQPDRVRLLGVDVVRDTIVHSETHDDAHDLQVVWAPGCHAGERPRFHRGPRRPAAVSESGSLWGFDCDPRGSESGVWITDGDGDNAVQLDDDAPEFSGLAFSPDEEWVAWKRVDDGHTVIGVGRTNGEDVSHPLEVPGTADVFWSTRGDRLIVYESGRGIVWSVDVDGTVEEAGMVKPGWDRVVCDASRSTALAVYEEGDETELLWVDLSTGGHLSSHAFAHRVSDLILRADGCVVARTRTGAFAIDLSVGRDREIPGIRIAPPCFRNTRWINGHPLNVMNSRPNVLELIALKVDVLLT